MAISPYYCFHDSARNVVTYIYSYHCKKFTNAACHDIQLTKY